jgi:hypothetical protein
MLRFKQIARVVFNTFFFAVTLFVPTGTTRWPRALIFLGVVFVVIAVTTLALPEDGARAEDQPHRLGFGLIY